MNPYINNNHPYNNMNNDRFLPAGAFLFGALTGGVAVAAFNPYRPRPYYPVNQGPAPYGMYPSYPPQYYPYYRPY